jgi:hypothetical protein
MPEDPFAVLDEYKELFDEEGVPDDTTVMLRKVVPSGSKQVPASTSDVTLGNAIVDDPDDRAEFGLTSIDEMVFRFWGGVFDTTDPEAAEEARRPLLLAATRNALKAAMEAGGGVVYDGVLLPIRRNGTPFKQGFTLRGVTMVWYIFTEAIRKTR